MTRLWATVAMCLALAGASPQPAPAQPLTPALESARSVTGGKARATSATTPMGVAPFYTASGRWTYSELRRWNSGFLPASLWLEYQRTSDPAVASAARQRTAQLRSQAANTQTMDVGFILMPSFGEGYRLTGSPEYRATLLTGAGSLATRYSSKVGAIRSRSNERGYWVSTDTMMNVELLYWGARNGGPSAWRDMATSQAALTLRDFMRADGSTYHYVLYDSRTGKVIERGQSQGYSTESTWSRGQAWVIHGMAIAYRETGDLNFLRAARTATDYWQTHAPVDLVPYWDFDAPNIPNEPKDSSAAAAAASAFVELSRLDPDPNQRSRFARLAESTLESLASPAYLGTPGFPAALDHGTFEAHIGAADCGTIWGDYYFAQALARLRTQVRRISGPDRYATSVATSRDAFSTSRTVILASGEAFPDALTASGLAGVYRAPVLLTRSMQLPSIVSEEIVRLGAQRVVIVGGPSSVGDSVMRAVDVLPGVGVTRIAGRDRYATSAAVAKLIEQEAGPDFAEQCVVVRGDVFSDALAVAPLAYSEVRPVLLTRPSSLPAEVAAVLPGVGTRGVTIVGGARSVGPGVESCVRALIGPDVIRVAGADRYETARRFADHCVSRRLLERDNVGVATGEKYPDALAGGAAAGLLGGPLLLTRGGAASETMLGWLRANAGVETEVMLFGGENSVNGLAENALRTALPEQ